MGRTEVRKRGAAFQMLALLGSYPQLICMLGAGVLCTARDLACAVTLAHATDVLLGGEGEIFSALLWMTIAMFGGAFTLALYNFCTERYTAFAHRKIMNDIYQKLPDFSLSWLQEQDSGKLLSVCSEDVEKLVRWAGAVPSNIFRQAVYLAGALGYALSCHALLTVIIFPVVVLMMPALDLISRPLKTLSESQRKEAAKSVSQMQEVLSDPEFVKAYSLEALLEERMEDALGQRRKLEQKGAIYQQILSGVSMIGSYLPGFLAAGAGLFFILRGELTPGFLVSFVQMVVQRFRFTIPNMAGMFSATRETVPSANRLLAFFNAPSERTSGEEGLMESAQEEEAVFSVSDLVFSYQEGVKVLDGVSFHVNRGETVALVGASGGGKSTLLKLLLGIYEPQQGEITCLGRTLSRWKPEALRELIAPVFQDTFLFPATLRENICGREKGRELALWEALENAGLAAFVRSLPKGPDTPVGERGTSLSGGQRQRLALARAFYKNTPILFFDEPTSALDTVTENQFQESYRRLRQGKTAIVVAHRLKTIREADRIYVLEQGKIVQEGSHRELIAVPGAYRRLYENQAKGEER